MMNKSLKEHLFEEYSDCIDTITKLSKNEHSKISSISDDKKLFNFDSIVKKFFNNENMPTSADAMYIDDKTITFIEFKGGFHDFINNKNTELLKCPKNNNIECDDYFKLFEHNRKKEKENLTCNLICKIIETFIFYKYELLNKYNSIQDITLNFLVVINDNLEDYESILLNNASGSSNISSSKSNPNNIIKKINQITKRFRNKNGRYYYHNVSAYGIYKFKEQLDKYVSL